MQIRGAKVSLARSRAIRSAQRSRRGKVLNGSSSRRSSSKTNSSSATNSSDSTAKTKKIALYEEVQKAADDMQKTIKKLIELGKTETESKKEMITCVEDFVKQYNSIYENLEDLGGSVNTIFLSQVKTLMENHTDALKSTGVTLNKNGTLSVTEKTLENTDLETLKNVYCKSGGLTEKLGEKVEYIGANVSSTIAVLNRMYGTSTYNQYGTSSYYYGNSGSWYNAIG